MISFFCFHLETIRTAVTEKVHHHPQIALIYERLSRCSLAVSTLQSRGQIWALQKIEIFDRFIFSHFLAIIWVQIVDPGLKIHFYVENLNPCQ